MKKIELSQGKVALIDDEDFDLIRQWKWYAHKTNPNAKTYYAVRTKPKSEGGGRVYMHRFIMGCVDPSIPCDHKDGDGLNNQRQNIRMCSVTSNRANQRKGENKSSKYKGVCYFKNRGYGNAWVAYVQADKKRFNLGYFKNEREAAIAYNVKASELFGEFAKLNVIE